MPRPKSKKHSVRLSIALDKAEYEELTRLGACLDLSAAWLIRRAVSEFVARHRAGKVHDGKASVDFLEALLEQLETTLERRHVLEMRMDAAFFRDDVVDLLEAEGAEYAIKVLRVAGAQGAHCQTPALEPGRRYRGVL